MISDLQVFNQYAYTTFLEKLSYNINLFNAATKGGLALSAGRNQGDFSQSTFYQRISGLVRRRNAYGTGAQSTSQIAMAQRSTVKIAAGTLPIDISPHYWQWLDLPSDQAGVLVGQQMAEDTLADMVAVAIKAFVAAQTNVGATVTSDQTAGTLTFATLNAGPALFGDRAAEIVCWIIHSKPMFDIFGVTLANSARLFNFGTVNVVADPFGRPFVITDESDLAYTSSGAKYHTLGLAPQAVMIEQNDDYFQNIITLNGDENIIRTWQAQWTFNMGLKGFTWDKTNGGASPTNAALATGTNWDKVAASIKDLPGVLVNSQ